MCILMSSNTLVFKIFFIWGYLVPCLTRFDQVKPWFLKHVTRVYWNFSKWKNRLCIKGRPWWALKPLYSNFFHLRSFIASFDLVWPSQILDFSKKTLWSDPRWSQLQKSWIQSLSILSRYIFGVMVNFSSKRVWTTQILNFKFSRLHARFWDPRRCQLEKSWIESLFHSSRSTCHT